MKGQVPPWGEKLVFLLTQMKQVNKGSTDATKCILQTSNKILEADLSPADSLMKTQSSWHLHYNLRDPKQMTHQYCADSWPIDIVR